MIKIDQMVEGTITQTFVQLVFLFSLFVGCVVVVAVVISREKGTYFRRSNHFQLDLLGYKNPGQIITIIHISKRWTYRIIIERNAECERKRDSNAVRKGEKAETREKISLEEARITTT